MLISILSNKKAMIVYKILRKTPSKLEIYYFDHLSVLDCKSVVKC